MSAESGYTKYWDEQASAPYSYNPNSGMLATYDDKRSIQLKTEYAVRERLNGVMFWELKHDVAQNGLLSVIDSVKNAKRTK